MFCGDFIGCEGFQNEVLVYEKVAGEVHRPPATFENPTLQQNILKFWNGSQGVVDNLFILRRIINHGNYLGKELWLTFYDIEKCFDSLWLEDCIHSLCDH